MNWLLKYVIVPKGEQPLEERIKRAIRELRLTGYSVLKVWRDNHPRLPKQRGRLYWVRMAKDEPIKVPRFTRRVRLTTPRVPLRVRLKV